MRFSRIRRLSPRVSGLVALALMQAGCASFAPTRLSEDQLGYSRALASSGKAQTLLNMVRLRYGDVPVFLNTTQVISGYQLQQNLSGGLDVFPNDTLSTYGAASAGVQLQQNPTFTFQPVTGKDLAQSVIRPLSPTELLPLTQSGIPIDILFRLAVQSVNGLQNSQMLASQDRMGDAGFFELLVLLRRLQMADLLGVRLDSGTMPMVKDAPPPGDSLILSVSDSEDAALQADVLRVRRMLGMRPGRDEARVIYGRKPERPGDVALVTRPMLGVLGQVGAEIKVSSADIENGFTVATVNDAGVLRRPAVIIQSGEAAPPDGFAQVQYRDRWYWIAADDFDSKVAFSIVQILLALAETNPAPGTVVTIPAR